MPDTPEEKAKPQKTDMSERIIRELPLIRRYSRHNVGEDMQFRAFLKNRLKMSNGELDGIVQETTDVVWAQVDCTACAHCCRTFEIVIDDRDIKRLAARLSVSLRSFLAQYVSTEKDGTKRFSSSPCPFLGEDNLCQVYEDRPQSCRDFPYLHTAGFRERSMTMMENVEACPIVFNVWQRLKRRLWRVNR